MRFAHYDENGKIVGFYDPDLHQDMPAPIVEISDADWQGHLDGSAPKVVDLNTYKVVDAPEKTAAELLAEREAAARAECRRRIYAAVDQQTQLNIATARAVVDQNDPVADDLVAGASALANWVASMRTAWPALAANAEADIAADSSWPPCPEAVTALVQTY